MNILWHLDGSNFGQPKDMKKPIKFEKLEAPSSVDGTIALGDRVRFTYGRLFFDLTVVRREWRSNGLQVVVSIKPGEWMNHYGGWGVR